MLTTVENMAPVPEDTNTGPVAAPRIALDVRDRLLLLILWLYHVILNVAWLWQDKRTPFADVPDHLANAFSVAQILAHPSTELFARIAETSGVRPPFLYVVTAPFIWLFGKSDDAANLANQLFLGLLIFCTYGIGRQLFAFADKDPRRQTSRWVGLSSAAFLSFIPLVFTFTRIYYADLALAGIVSLSLWLLLKSDRFRRTGYAVAFGLSLAAGMLTKQMFFAFVLGPTALVGIQALFLPRPATASVAGEPVHGLRRLWLRIRPVRAHWNLVLVILVAAIFLPWYLSNLTSLGAQAEGLFARLEDPNLLGARGYSKSFFWYLSFFDDGLGGFFLLVLAIGVIYALWRIVTPKRLDPGEAPGAVRFAYGFPVVWVTVSYIVHTAISNGHVRYMLPVMPAIALLSVAWIVELLGTAASRTDRQAAGASNRRSVWLRRVLVLVTMAIVAVGITNFMIISWGAPASLASALNVQPSNEFRPMHHTMNSPLIAPGRAIYHQYPPKTEDWLVGDIVRDIANDCQAEAGCSVIVMPCVYSYERRPFIYYSAIQDNDDRLRFRGVSQNPNYYRSFLDVEYVVGKTGNHACGLAGVRVEHLETLLSLIDGPAPPLFQRRFETMATYGPLPDGSTGYVLRRKGALIDEMETDRRQAMLEHVMVITPENERVRQDLTRLLRQTGEVESIIALREEAVALAPQDVAARIDLAQAYLDDGRTGAAIDQLEAARELDPSITDQVTIERALAKAFAAVESWEQAGQAFDRAVALAPDDANLRLDQGLFFEELANSGEVESADAIWKQARDAFETAIKLRTDTIQAYQGLARYYQNQGDATAALSVYQQALNLMPDNPWLNYATAGLYADQGDLDSALYYSQHAIELLPSQPDFQFQLAQVYRMSEQWDRAKAAYTEALRLRPEFENSLAFQLGVGQAELGLGDSEAAATALQRVLTMQPQHLAAKYYLALALESAGDVTAARAAYQAVIEQAPRSDFGQLATERLAQLGS